MTPEQLAARLSALTAQVERRGRMHKSLSKRFADANSAREAAEAEVSRLRDRLARMEGALKPFCFYSENEPNGDIEDAVQYAWEIRYQDRFKDWIDFADITAARAALTETPADGGKHE